MIRILADLGFALAGVLALGLVAFVLIVDAFLDWEQRRDEKAWLDG